MNVFSDLKGFLRVKYISIDNKLFQLHYKVTSITLLAFSAIIASKQHFGNPIECLPDTSTYSKTDDMKDLLNTYCWVQTTYTIPDYLNGTIGKDIIYPGVGPHNSRSQTRIHHRYYQWIVFLLFFQGIAFLTPHFIWRIFECGKMAMLSKELKNPMDAEDVIASKRKLILNYFTKNMGYNNLYANCYIFCEILNFINVIVQIWITDLILGHQFRHYGSDVVKYMEMKNSVTFDTKHQVNPMTKLFPRVSKCNLRLYGSGGNIQIHDAICMLPLNIINEKIYIILWFWFIFLTLISFLGLLYRGIAIASETIRFLLLRTRTQMNSNKSVKIICKQCNFADWFVLYQLSKNIDSLVYKEIINDLASQFQQNVAPEEKEALLKEEIQKTIPNILLPTVSKSSSVLSLPPPPPSPSPPPWILENMPLPTEYYGITKKIVTDV